LVRLGYAVGLMDADIYGPSQQLMMGIDEKPYVDKNDNRLLPIQRHGVRIATLGALMDPDRPAVWRNTNSLKFDAALQYRWAHFRDGANFGVSVPPPGPLPSAVGERDRSEWRLKLSLILRLSATRASCAASSTAFSEAGSALRTLARIDP